MVLFGMLHLRTGEMIEMTNGQEAFWACALTFGYGKAKLPGAMAQ